MRRLWAAMGALLCLSGCSSTGTVGSGTGTATRGTGVDAGAGDAARGPELNVGLLATGLYDEMVLEVDVAGTCTPDAKALAGLASFAGSLLEPARITVDGPERIEESEWPRDWNLDAFHDVAAAHMRADLGPRQGAFYVLYVDREDRTPFLGGLLVNWIAPDGANAPVVPGMVVVCGALENAPTFVARSTIEEYVLKHEFGHALGLTWNPAHQEPEVPSHCRSRRCLMKSFWGYGIVRYLSLGLPWSRLPKAPCEACLADVAAARARASSRTSDQNRTLARRQADFALYATNLQLGRIPQVIELGRALGARYPEDPAALRAAWTAHALAGETDAALAAVSRASALDGGPKAHLDIARLLCALGAYDAAAASIRSRFAPDDDAALDTLAWALEGSGRLQEAIDALDAFLARHPPARDGRVGDREQVLVDKARLLRLAGRPRDALLELETLPRDHARWRPDWLVELAQTSSALGDAAASGKALVEARDGVRFQIAHMLGAALVVHWQLRELEIEALLGARTVPEPQWKALMSSMEGVFEKDRPFLWLRVAGVLAMFGDLEGAAEWCGRSQAAVVSVTRAQDDPALSDTFAALRNSGRMSARYPWCTAGAAGPGSPGETPGIGVDR